MNILAEFRRITEQEITLRRRTAGVDPPAKALVSSAVDFRWLNWRLAEVARSSLVPRSYIANYGLGAATVACESVGAHANLVSALADAALDFEYGPDFGSPDATWPRTIDGYTRREVIEAARIHDLAENDIGDWPDNGARNESAKQQLESRYFERFISSYPADATRFSHQVRQLLIDMQEHTRPTGRLLYLADKTTAILVALCYDAAGHPPLMRIDDPAASLRDREEMLLCDYCDAEGRRKASEMWTVDHFHLRRIVDLDENNFFTSVIVMRTLEVNRRWYLWRERDYGSA